MKFSAILRQCSRQNLLLSASIFEANFAHLLTPAALKIFLFSPRRRRRFSVHDPHNLMSTNERKRAEAKVDTSPCQSFLEETHTVDGSVTLATVAPPPKDYMEKNKIFFFFCIILYLFLLKF